MSVRALLRSFFQGVSHTLVVSVVLLALFNSTIWVPALEASSSGASISTSLDASPAIPAASPSSTAPPKSSGHPISLLTEPKDAPTRRAAVVPATIDTRAARKSTDAAQPSLQAMSQKLGALRPVFIENKGQFDARVRFQVRSGGKTLWLTDSGIVFDVVEGDSSARDSSTASSQLTQEHTPGQPPADLKIERHVICQDFVSANHDVVIETKGVQEGTYNYFSGNDPAKWQTKVRAYSEVVYHDIWNGVDLRLYANGSDLEQEFIVKPGAEISQVRVAYRGIEGLEIAKDGSLVINTAAGAMHESKPRIYQEKAGKHSVVQGQFELLSENSYTFSIAEHDPQYALVIDPTVLYSTYLGGSAGNDIYRANYEVATGVAVDAGGSAYVTGYTMSQDFPVTAGAFQTTYAGANEAGFISKFNATGSALVYSSYLDNTIYSPVGIAVDAMGNAYVTGVPDQNGFPTTANAYSPACKVNAFLSVLDPTGSTLLYSTCFGQTQDHNASQYVWASGIAVDSNGHAFIVGYVSSNGAIPTTPNAFQTSSLPGYGAAFVTGFDTKAPGASSLFYSTYFGPTSSDYYTIGVWGSSIAVDSFGKIYMTGNTGSNLPVTPGAFQRSFISCNKCSHSFVAKLDPVAPIGQSLIYSTYLEGSYQDVGTGIAVDGLGNAFAIGTTYSSDFPTTPGAFQAVPISGWGGGNGHEGFVAKLNAGGSGVGYASFIEPVYGGGVTANGIAVDTFGDAYITGWFRANQVNMPITTDAFQSTYSKLSTDFSESFLMKVDPTGSTLIYSSYLGGEGDDVANAVAVDQTGDAYVVGHTSSYLFPVTAHAFQSVMHGTGDAFVTKLPLGSSGVLSITEVLPNSGGNAGSVTATIIGAGFHGGATVTLGCGTSIVTGSNASVTAGGLVLTATFDLTSSSPGTCNVVVTNPDQISATVPNGFTVQQGGAANLQIQKIGSPAVAGRNITYVITVQNTGNIDSAPEAVTEVLDPWYRLVYSNPSATTITPELAWFPPSAIGGTYNASLEWDLPMVPANAQITLLYAVILDSNAPVNAQVNGQACLSTRQVSLVCNGAYFACVSLGAIGCGALIGTLPLYFACLGGAVTGCVAARNLCFSHVQGICRVINLAVKAAADPNDLSGPPGVGLPRWIGGAEPLTYALTFENLPTATAAVQRALATNPLNMATDDLRTLKMSSMTVADHPVPIPLTFNPLAGLNQFDTNLDLRPAKNLFVQIHAGMDPSTGLITWIFQAIDPTTGLPPTDPTVGFLDPGASVSLFFTAKPKAGLSTGTRVSDQATITFDANQPMSTPVWTNTLDNNAPVSRVAALPATESCSNFKVQWSGSDIGAGTQSYTVYASDNGAGFVPWLTNTSSTSSVFQGQVGHSYGFYSVARDLVGNIESAKTSAEASTRVTSASSCGPPSLSGAASVVSYVNNTLSLNLQLTDIGTSDALNTLVKTLTFRTLGGTGTVTLASPTLPFIFGTVSVDNTITIPVTLNVPATVTRFSMTEGGTMQDSHGKTYNFSLGQNVVP